MIWIMSTKVCREPAQTLSIVIRTSKTQRSEAPIAIAVRIPVRESLKLVNTLGGGVGLDEK
jgi:hypothetical protein